MEFKKLIKKRKSVRRYSDKKPPAEEIMELIDAANLAPSPGNLPLLQFIVVEDPEKIEKIATACQQQWIKEVPYLVVFCSLPKKAILLYDKRANRYIKHHSGAAIENFLLKSTDMGLASCWVGAFSDLTIKNLLRVPDNVGIEAVIPVGYEHISNRTKQKTKVRLGERTFFETWKNKFQIPFIKVRRKRY